MTQKPYTYQEISQGARDETEFQKRKDYLSGQCIYALPAGLDAHLRAARLYYDLRKKGVTIRSTIDVLIALTAIEKKRSLLRCDSDFDHMAAHLADLRILNGLSDL